MKNLQKGFTLIELLVVIAIIGILSSIVLASLSSARSKGEDAAIKTTLSNMRAQAELYYSNNSTYTSATKSACDDSTNIAVAGTIFGTSTVGGLNALRKGLVDKAGSGANTSCSAGGTSWAAAAALKSGGTACADSTGASISSTTNNTAANLISASSTCL